MMNEPTVIGDATLYQGDCLEVIPRLVAFDCAVTSPPYNLGGAPWARLGHWKPGNKSGAGGRAKWKTGADGGVGIVYGHHEDAMEWSEYVAWQRIVLSAMWGKLSSNGAIFFNHKPRVIGTRLWTPLELVPPEIELRQIITWARPGGINYSPAAFVPTCEWIMLLAKPAFRLKSKGVSGLGDVWRMNPDRNDHPAPFPLELPSKVMEATTRGVVFDPFMGSGTTGIAALRSGRRFIGCEIEPRYFDMACSRLEAEAGSLLAMGSSSG